MADNADKAMQAKAMEMTKVTRLVAMNLTTSSTSIVSLKAGDAIGNIGTEVEHGIRRNDDGTFTAFLAAEFECFSQKEPERILGKIACTYAAKYTPSEPSLLQSWSDEDLLAYAVIFSPLHLWPYVREFSQTMAQRMMLPPLVLPPFGKVSPEVASAQAIAAAVKASREQSGAPAKA